MNQINASTVTEDVQCNTAAAAIISTPKKLSGDKINLDLLRKNFSQWQDPAILFSIVILSAISAFTLLPAGTLYDEGFHWHQMLEYFAGHFGTVPSLTMYPGYHRILFGISEIFSITSLPQIRYVCFVLAIPALLFFLLIARNYDKESCYPVSLQLFLNPLIFPFFFLLYTDIASLSMIMAAAWLVLVRGNYQMAAIVMGVSMLIRQTNVIWLVMFWAVSLSRLGFFNLLVNDFSKAIRNIPFYLWKTFIFFLACIAFAAFLYINKGIAIGDVGSHQIGFHPTQLFFLLFILFFLFIPLHLSNLPRIILLFKSEPLIPFSACILFALYIFSYDTNHGYNSPQLDGYLRNNLLAVLRDNFFAKMLAFIPMLIAFFSLLLTPLRRREHYWIYPFMALSLLPIYLIEQRYFYVSIALFTLLRKPMSRQMEYLQLTIYVPLTVYIFDGISHYRFFI